MIMLLRGTTYYVRGYLENSTGIFYGNTVTTTTPAAPACFDYDTPCDCTNETDCLNHNGFWR